MEKKLMRKNMLKLRDSISHEAIISKSNIILKKLEETSFFQKVKNIMTFVSFGTEVYTHDVIKKYLQNDKLVLVPIVDKQTQIMRASILNDFKDLQAGYKNILEVKEEKIQYFEEDKIQLILTPCVCYDLQGYRLGYGKGFYDKFFSKATNAFKIGLCFDEMIVDEISRNEYDKKVDMIISDKRIIM